MSKHRDELSSFELFLIDDSGDHIRFPDGKRGTVLFSDKVESIAEAQAHVDAWLAELGNSFYYVGSTGSIGSESGIKATLAKR